MKLIKLLNKYNNLLTYEYDDSLEAPSSLLYEICYICVLRIYVWIAELQ